MRSVLAAFTQGLIFLGSTLAISAPPGESLTAAFWVWHRPEGVPIQEQQVLSREGVERLYLHLGDVRVRESAEPEAPQTAWQLRPTAAAGQSPPSPAPDQPLIVPVIRFQAGPEMMEQSAAADEYLITALTELAEMRDAGILQIDYDCPTRLLRRYAGFLARLREALRPCQLSITALAGYAGAPGFDDLQDAVDELAPMFYDLRPEAAMNLRAGRYTPLYPAEEANRLIADWQSCRTPWLAGLPSFARATIYTEHGTLAGHLREWSWEEILRDPRLRAREIEPGTVRVERLPGQPRNIRISRDAGLAEGQYLIIRRPEQGALANAVRLAREAGAAGIIWFRLPHRADSGGMSVRNAVSLTKNQLGQPNLRLRARHGELTLQNIGTGDLWPLSGDDPMPANLLVIGSSEAPPSLSSPRITIPFWHLRAGDGLQTGIEISKLPSTFEWRVNSGPWYSADKQDLHE